MKNFNYFYRNIFILFLISLFSFLSAQQVGDYRSLQNGDWTSSTSWEVYKAGTWQVVTSGYPGTTTIPSGSANGTVTIQAGHTISFPTPTGTQATPTAYNFGDLIINGTLNIGANSNGNWYVSFPGTQNVLLSQGNLQLLSANGDSHLYLPSGAAVVIINGASIGGNICNANKVLYIGTAKYAACTGGAYQTFDDMNTSGGSLISKPVSNPQAICNNNGSATIKSANTSTEVDSYLWTLPPPGGWSGTTSLNTNTLGTITFTQPGNYVFTLKVSKTVKIQGTNYTLYDTQTLVVSVGQTNTVTPSNSPTICVNQSMANITHTTTVANGINQPGVSGANGLPPGVVAYWAQNVITISGTPTAIGTYMYNIPLTGGCGTISATGTITVGGKPVISNMTTTVCSATDFTVTPQNGINGVVPPNVNYSWNPTTIPVGISNAVSGSGTSIGGKLTNNTTGALTVVYTVTPTSVSCGTGTPFTVSVIVNPSTAASVSIASDVGTTICSGSSVTFTASPTNGGTAPGYQWKLNDGDISGATSSTYTTTSLNNGDKISVVLTSNATPCLTGSPATSNVITMTVNPSPIPGAVSISAPNICAGESSTLSLLGSTGNIQWQDSSDNITFNNIAGANSTIYNTGALSSLRYYRAVLTLGTCSVISQPVSINAGQVTIWNGSNWTVTPTPNNNLAAIIEAPYNSTGNLNICSLSVTNNAVAKINLGHSFTVKNGITVASGSDLIVESDANLLQINDTAVNSGNITVKRNIKFKSSARDQYNYLISPVIGQSLKTIYPGVPTTATYPYVLYHNEANNKFYNSTGAYIPGRGLAVKEPSALHIPADNVDAEFKGVPANGVISNNLAFSNLAHGFNLVGNPYPSNIDLRLLYVLNGGSLSPQVPATTAKILPTFYFWDNTANDISVQLGDIYNGRAYAVYNAYSNIGNEAGFLLATSPLIGNKKPNKIVKIGQGFMVRTTGSSNTLIYNNSIRTDESTGASFFSKMTTNADRYWLTLQTPNKMVNSIAVTYFGGGINGFGLDDSEHILNTPDLLYSIVEDHKLQIEGKPNFVDSDKIILGANHFIDGKYTFSLAEKEGVFAHGQSIYLKDNQTGIITDLTKGKYEYYSLKGETTGRFEIIYSNKSTMSSNDFLKEELRIYRDANNFVIKAQSKNITDVEIYDASGKLIYKRPFNDSKIVLNSDVIINGLYILKIKQGNTETVKKIVK